MAEVEDKLLDHNYDGIEEYDNPLPGWWVGLFILTIIFGAFYVAWYHFIPDGGKGQIESYTAEYNNFLDEKKALLASGELEDTGFNEGDSYEFVSDEATLAKGKKIYTSNCASCHLDDGGGQIGPNLTDKYWIHGGSMTDIVMTVANGVQENGMIAWKPILSKKDIIAVSSFVYSLEGKTPANPKEPQGEIYKRDESSGSSNSDTISESSESNADDMSMK